MSQKLIKEEEIQELKESLRRCPEGTFEAALAYRESGDPEQVPSIVMGIVERFLEPELRPKLKEGDDSLRLIEDLGVDSLTMMEIVILVEETVGISFDNQELREIRTVGEVKEYMNRKIRGDSAEDGAEFQSFGSDDLISLMPMQPPFLFLQQAKLFANEAEGSYKIVGDEFFLRGHFRDNPIMPASLILEALGQLAVLYLLRGDHPDLSDGIVADSVYFTSCDGIRCQKVCKPGDTLSLKIRPKRFRHPLAFFEGSVTVKGEKAAFAESITLTFDLQTSSAGTSGHLNGVNLAVNGDSSGNSNRIASNP